MLLPFLLLLCLLTGAVLLRVGVEEALPARMRQAGRGRRYPSGAGRATEGVVTAEAHASRNSAGLGEPSARGLSMPILPTVPNGFDSSMSSSTSTRFVHLRVQSAYSMLEGSMHPKDIAKLCVKHHMPAAALTDRNVLFGAMEFSDYLLDSGVQPIIGSLLCVKRPQVEGAQVSSFTGPKAAYDSLVLLAQNETGYANLIRLVSAAHLGVDGAEQPHVTLEAFEGMTDGLIALTAGYEGAVARLLDEDQERAAEDYLARLEGLFPGRLYVELTRIGDAAEAKVEPLLIELAHRRDVPLVATNPVLYEAHDFHAAHDAMLCIADSTYVDEPNRRRSNPETWFKSPRQMEKLFQDVPEALANTTVIARRCAVAAPSRKPILPNYAPGVSEAEVVSERARQGLAGRLEKHVFKPEDDAAAREEKAKPYRERLEYELGIINQMGFPGYFLIVSDFIQWAKDNGIPVGPGRGSGAGSLVAWALAITDLDPLRLGLLFERFLNPERVSMPDFDIDFCETRRGEVIRYVQEKYGRDQVAQIITFGKLKARAVVKDVGRVLQMSYGQVDGISKLIPNNPADPKTLVQALDEVPELRKKRYSEKGADRLFDIALKLEGMYRHTSTHAAGVVIGDRPLDQLVPLYRDPRSDMPVTQFDMKWVEKAGLVKFDFLGLKTLSVLQKAVDFLKHRGVDLDLSSVPWDDPAAFQLLARGDTVGVFQLESEGMRRTLAMVKPDKFEDIIALVALYRPGPMDNIPTYANRKHGLEEPDYLHPWLEEVLAETYGVIIYQEQVMQIAQILAGYSLGEADLLRRAMGKKKKEEMDAQKARFLEGAKEKGVDVATADHIFELVAKFAGYGFNKSHAAAYALVAYHTAYLKANYPVEFYAASMCYDMHLTDKLSIFVEDMKRLQMPVLPPDVNRSEAEFSVEALPEPSPSGQTLAVRYALAALKGVGEKAMEGLVDERKAQGPFKSLTDFAERIDPRLVNKKQLEGLAAGGAFDGLEPNRAAAHAGIEAVLNHAQAAAEARASAQVSLFGEATGVEAQALQLPRAEPWPLGTLMDKEREAFGFYFSAHPLDAYTHVLRAHNVITYAEAINSEPPTSGNRLPATLAGMIESCRWRQPPPRDGKQGNRYLMVDISDQSGQYMSMCFDEEAQGAIERAASAGDLVLIAAELMWREGDEAPRVTVRGVTPLEALADRTQAEVTVYVRSRDPFPQMAGLLSRSTGGRGRVKLHLMLSGGARAAEVMLPERYRVDPNLCAALRSLPGIDDAKLIMGGQPLG